MADTIKMERDKPAEGGPVTADVHPGEVQNWIESGWRIVESEMPATPEPEAPKVTRKRK